MSIALHIQAKGYDFQESERLERNIFAEFFQWSLPLRDAPPRKAAAADEEDSNISSVSFPSTITFLYFSGSPAPTSGRNPRDCLKSIHLKIFVNKRLKLLIFRQ